MCHVCNVSNACNARKVDGVVHVCMHACMYVGRLINICMHASMHVCMRAWMSVCMYAYMYI